MTNGVHTCVDADMDFSGVEGNIVAASKECIALVDATLEHEVLTSLGFCCGKGAAWIGVAGPGEHNSSLTQLPVTSGGTWKQKHQASQDQPRSRQSLNMQVKLRQHL